MQLRKPRPTRAEVRPAGPEATAESSGPTARQTSVARFVVAAIGSAVMLLVLAGYLKVTRGSGAARLVGDVAVAAASGLASLACLRASRRDRAGARGWFLIGLAAGLYTLAAAIFTFYGVTRNGAYPFPAVFDIGFLGYAPFAAAGLLAFPAGGVWLLSRVRTVLDGVLIASSVFFISWSTILGPAFLTSTDAFSYRLAIAYPVIDLAMAAVVLALFMRKPAGSRMRFGLLAAGFLILSLTDSIYAGRTLAGLPSAGTVLITGWVCCWIAVALATIAPVSGVHARTMKLNPLQEFLPYVPVVVVMFIAAGRPMSLHADPILVIFGGIVLVAVILRQVVLTREHSMLASERKAVEDRMRHEAFHDPLIGLANRLLFKDRLAQALARGERSGAEVGVLFLDLDDFKEVNDSLGHAAGDVVLLATADRLRQVVRPSDTVARFGGDEFAILVEDCGQASHLDNVGDRVEAAVAAPIQLNGVEVVVEASVGSAAGTSHDSVDEVLRNADLAMYVAKAQSKGHHARFTPEMHSISISRLEMVADLRRAVEEDQFLVVYQPKVALSDGQVTGFEALVRWLHPVRGVVQPSDFIPLAENVGLIGAIGELVLRKACIQLAAWHAVKRTHSITMAVNLSARQVMDMDITVTVAAVLADTGIPPGSLELEITVTAIMDDVNAVVPVLRALRDLGVSLSIDDFGTGYSSLTYLKEFPVGCLKIDRGFVAGLGRNEQDAALVSVVIAVAKALGMTSVAEGVETFEQLIELERLGCDYAQGFFLGRPEAPELASAFIGQVIPTRKVELVLVCDDDAMHRLLSRMAFEQAGATVAEEVDGTHGVERARTLQPDLIVLDLEMPNLDGMSALPMFRAACPQATIIIVSATTDNEVVDTGLHTGAVACFDKGGFVARIPALIAEYRRIPHLELVG